MPAPKPHHKRRHRKKLHLGEFQQLGFTVSAQCPPGWSEDDRERAMLALIAGVEARDLSYGGGDSASGMDGYVYANGGRSADEADREALREALGNAGFVGIEIGALDDAWYAEGPEA